MKVLRGLIVPRFLLFLSIMSSVVVVCTRAENGNSTVSGVVFNKATGEPIQNASVSLCRVPAGRGVPPCTSTMSGPEGRFAFRSRLPGRYFVQSDTSGYLHDVLVLDGRGGREFDLPPGAERAVRLALWPEGSVIGRIVDESGRPISDVSVAAVDATFAYGKRSLRRYQYWGGPSETPTDKDGRFRINSLKPGNYFIEGVAGFPSKTVRGVLASGYLPIFYPDAAFVANARTVCVGAGRQVEVDFHLIPRQQFFARARLEIPANFKRKFEPISGLWREDGEVDPAWDNEYDHSTRIYSAGPLPAGSYDIEVKTGIYETDLVGRYKFEILDHDPETMTVAMRQPFALQVRVNAPEGFRMRTPFSTRLRLQPDNEPMDGIDESGWPIPKDGVLRPVLQPGHYRLFLFSDDDVYIRSARFGDQDVVVTGLTLNGASEDKLELTLERANGTVPGTVISSTGVPDPGADVKLILRGSDSHYVYRSVVADRQGRFQFSGVPPGSYDLIALNDPIRDWEFGPVEWSLVERSAQKVTVGDSALKPIKLEAVTLRYDFNGCPVETQ
jgi:hypothetical protein